MKVLLVAPAHRYKDKYPQFLSASDFPAGIAYIASALKRDGHEVSGCNPNNKPFYKSAKDMVTAEITSAIVQHQPDLIGLGGICTDYAFLKDAIEIIRRITKSPIVLGGNIVTNDAEFIYNDLKPDFAVVGEGEEAITSIANGCENKGIIKFSQEKYQPLDNRAFPDYELFDIKDMIDNFSMVTRVLYRYSRPYPRPYNIVASRSCPFTCTFCLHGHRNIKYHARSIPNIMAEIKESYDKYRFNIVILLDELFAVKKDRLRDFSLAVLEGKEKYGWDFDWCFQTHCSARFDLDTLKLAKRAGCYFFSYGLESASPTVLKSMQKKTRVDQMIEAIKLAREANIGFGGNLIFGDPAETLETIRESLKFWFDWGQTEEIFMGFVVPYPGSKIFDDCVARGLIPDKKGYYDIIDNVLVNMTAIPTDKLQSWFNFINFLEHTWVFVKAVKMKRYEAEEASDRYTTLYKAKAYKIYADCPHCGAEIMSRQIFDDFNKAEFLGIGCTNCGRKSRVDIGG